MAAFIASDTGELTGFVSILATALIGLSGVGLGLIEVAGTAIMIDGWKRKGIGSKPWKILTAFLVGTACLSLVILIPFTVSRLDGRSIAEVMPGAFGWLWAAAVNLDPFIILAGVSMCQVEKREKPVKITKPAVKFRYVCEVCGYGTDNQRALAGHMRKHTKK
jgi:hypothetical protein